MTWMVGSPLLSWSILAPSPSLFPPDHQSEWVLDPGANHISVLVFAIHKCRCTVHSGDLQYLLLAAHRIRPYRITPRFSSASGGFASS
ncbi:uncharacterized protein BO72DRAFT_452287 [Aspergillus fijiensis CBS 313.89]|uniref:Secreted protein n=1 Tax=Aspergillus fijiensis CBS 313.89 TaxID=1448319 RepID=A0A8G1VV44_9EURO|nr:uncharacterized protein BO72DRAFT_452287 [Aspergillus fijiensis CBS 313.89]RAK72796.1 hypothetical protein BO72DRAFT_452287 [Aspergillus fijiensis CBS 313.89]